MILSTVRPRHLLAGKVIGIGLLGLAQLALVAGLAATLLAAGVFDAPAALGGSLALVVPWFALGFAPLRGRLRRRGRARLPAAGREHGGTARRPTRSSRPTSSATSPSRPIPTASSPHVLTVFPLTAPLVLPARSALVGVPLWEHALAVVLVLALDLRARPLRRPGLRPGLLQAGPGLGPRAAWRLTHRELSASGPANDAGQDVAPEPARAAARAEVLLLGDQRGRRRLEGAGRRRARRGSRRRRGRRGRRRTRCSRSPRPAWTPAGPAPRSLRDQRRRRAPARRPRRRRRPSATPTVATSPTA